jgi:Leucine-rich repeat (LRR) protein
MAMVSETNTLPRAHDSTVSVTKPNEKMMIRGRVVRIPQRVFEFSKQVKDLDISFNLLSSVPKDIKKLKQLQAFAATANRIEKITKQIYALEFLTQLDLSDNLINKLPEEFARLKFVYKALI